MEHHSQESKEATNNTKEPDNHEKEAQKDDSRKSASEEHSHSIPSTEILPNSTSNTFNSVEILTQERSQNEANHASKTINASLVKYTLENQQISNEMKAEVHKMLHKNQNEGVVIKIEKNPKTPSVRNNREPPETNEEEKGLEQTGEEFFSRKTSAHKKSYNENKERREACIGCKKLSEKIEKAEMVIRKMGTNFDKKISDLKKQIKTESQSQDEINAQLAAEYAVNSERIEELENRFLTIEKTLRQERAQRIAATSENTKMNRNNELEMKNECMNDSCCSLNSQKEVNSARMSIESDKSPTQSMVESQQSYRKTYLQHQQQRPAGFLSLSRNSNSNLIPLTESTIVKKGTVMIDQPQTTQRSGQHPFSTHLNNIDSINGSERSQQQSQQQPDPIARQANHKSRDIQQQTRENLTPLQQILKAEDEQKKDRKEREKLVKRK